MLVLIFFETSSIPYASYLINLGVTSQLNKLGENLADV